MGASPAFEEGGTIQEHAPKSSPVCVIAQTLPDVLIIGGGDLQAARGNKYMKNQILNAAID
jgi:hypothetical protein